MTTLRVLRTAKATLTRTFYLDEEVEGASGSVAVSVTRLDGTVVQAGNATGPNPDGAYTFTFQGSDVLDQLRVSWAATVGGDAVTLDQDMIDVVGGFYFSLAEGRATDPALADTGKFPSTRLRERRDQVETECERLTGQAWVPRFRRATLTGTGRTVLVLPDPQIRAVRAVTVNGSAFTSGELAGVGFNESGLLYLSSGWRPSTLGNVGNVVVEYEHGHDRPDPDLVEAARLRFKSLCLEGRANLPDRAERQGQVGSDGGRVVDGSPTAEKTGLPAVDAVYARLADARPGFG